MWHRVCYIVNIAIIICRVVPTKKIGNFFFHKPFSLFCWHFQFNCTFIFVRNCYFDHFTDKQMTSLQLSYCVYIQFGWAFAVCSPYHQNSLYKCYRMQNYQLLTVMWTMISLQLCLPAVDSTDWRSYPLFSFNFWTP